ncbi:MAG: folate-binding protein YgfZ [Proteobacteria bacterium]|nr:folate-binding protein YgfZ [Pseudomonadota bacterium]
MDAKAFLQGQLSNDLERLTPARSLLAGYHNPQGRVVALLRLVQQEDDDLLAVAPRDLLAPLMERLRRYILRARVRLDDASEQWQVTGVLSDDAMTRAGGALPLQLGAYSTRALLLTPRQSDGATSSTDAALQLLWRQRAIAEGEPQVWAPNSEAFVAQMLNLDVLGAIAFDKGCYTGQEVIARAHYRGRVKRRMQRFVTGDAAVSLRCGDSGTFSDGRPFRVVDAVPVAGGGYEFLAVTSLPGSASDAAMRGDATEAERHAGTGGGAAMDAPARVHAQSLPLPYELPV